MTISFKWLRLVKEVKPHVLFFKLIKELRDDWAYSQGNLQIDPLPPHSFVPIPPPVKQSNQYEQLLEDYRSALSVANRLYSEVAHYKAVVESQKEMIRNRDNVIALLKQSLDQSKAYHASTPQS